MTKKDYEAMAEWIKHELGIIAMMRPDKYSYHDIVVGFVEDMADYLESQNPKFKANLFLTQCGVQV